MSFRYTIEAENPIVIDGNKMFNCKDGKLRLKIVEANPWHTGTPTENGYYLCKVFYDKETENDMRILEWVNELGCFCIPDSKIRAYHYYIGENNGEHVEVVYEWQKLDMRFRMETKWIEPFEADSKEGEKK